MIEIKGITLPVVVIRVLEKGDVGTIVSKIREKLSSKLFKDSYILIDGGGVLSDKEVESIEKELLEKGVKSIKKLTLKEEERGGRLLIVQKHLRSGQKVEHNGDVLVLGDVNKDAQVIATGNIVVMGKLRGVAIAGALGDETAVVVALDMAPQQIRIGKKVAILSDEEREPLGYPEIAKVEDGSIILERV
ncbi:MAG: septum site-determining protein MinC [Aquificota bacterium]|nr:MAG: septum site-determining protein MinC [Aquificota bacterium]